MEEYVLLLTIHTIISDGWSVGVLVRKSGHLYDFFPMTNPLGCLNLRAVCRLASWRRQHSRRLEKQLIIVETAIGRRFSCAVKQIDSRSPVPTFRGRSNLCDFLSTR